tara:strand:- start:38004 stop:38297 length:294 start_codon:yes stop_codon:yes gene_type:complete
MPSAPPPVDASYAEKIKWLREDSEDYPRCLTEPTPKNDTKDVERAVEELKVSELSEEEQIEAIRKEFLYIGGPRPKRTSQAKEEGIKKESEDAVPSS